jgi:LacI family transcriptional regulator
VLNGDPRLSIAPDTRRRVVDAIEHLGYRPNIMARGLRLSRTLAIALVLPDISNPVYGQIVTGAQVRAEEVGYAIVLASPLDHDGVEPSLARLLSEGRFDGLLVASAMLDAENIRELAGRAPVVVMNRRVEGVEGTVVLDDAAGSAMATRHLLDLGHRRLAHLGGPADVDTSIRRQLGFERATSRRRGTHTVVVAGKGYDAQTGYEAATTLLKESGETTGIFAANVMLAIGAIRAAAEQGRRIPEDLSIVALHDFQLAAYVQPPLTTVAMPLEELGSRAVDVLLARIEGKQTGSTVIKTPPRLIVRQSTAPPFEVA